MSKILTKYLFRVTSSVAGNTTLFTILGFSWAITQWAPFVLVSQSNSFLKTRCSTYLLSQLAEAILSESTTSDDASSIRLGDRRADGVNHTMAYSDPTEEERQHFLADDGEEDDDDSLPHRPPPPSRSRPSESPVRTSARPSLEHHRRTPSALNIMQNAGARLSTLDVHSHATNGHSGQKPASSNLAAKSGIILVSDL
jgi:solute carrier family 45, member 1/2/4